MLKNKTYKQSIYVTLGIIIISTVLIIMSIQSTYTYIATKKKMIQDMKHSSKITISSLQKNVANHVESYSVNEYEKLVLNEMGYKSIFAIIVEDYNMGKILGRGSFISAKIRDANLNIIDFNPKNSEHIKQIDESYYFDKQDLVSSLGDKLGTITIYSSDHFMNIELNNIIIGTLIKTVLISILLTLSLFITIRIFILKPLSNIIQVISRSYDD